MVPNGRRGTGHDTVSSDGHVQFDVSLTAGGNYEPGHFRAFGLRRTYRPVCLLKAEAEAEASKADDAS